MLNVDVAESEISICIHDPLTHAQDRVVPGESNRNYVPICFDLSFEIQEDIFYFKTEFTVNTKQNSSKA